MTRLMSLSPDSLAVRPSGVSLSEGVTTRRPLVRFHSSKAAPASP